MKHFGTSKLDELDIYYVISLSTEFLQDYLISRSSLHNLACHKIIYMDELKAKTIHIGAIRHWIPLANALHSWTLKFCLWTGSVNDAMSFSIVCHKLRDSATEWGRYHLAATFFYTFILNQENSCFWLSFIKLKAKLPLPFFSPIHQNTCAWQIVSAVLHILGVYTALVDFSGVYMALVSSECT